MADDQTKDPLDEAEQLKAELQRVLAETEAQRAAALDTLARARQLLAEAQAKRNQGNDTTAAPDLTVSDGE